MRMSKKKKEMEQSGSLSKHSKIILRGWQDTNYDWRSRWLRQGTGSTLTHCTLTIGDLTLHVNYKGSNWYPTHRLLYTYQGYFELEKEIYIGSIKRPIYIRPDPGSTWSVIRWKYLLGPRPKCCTTACIDALRQNGIECPELIVPHKLIEHYDNSRNERQGPLREINLM